MLYISIIPPPAIKIMKPKIIIIIDTMKEESSSSEGEDPSPPIALGTPPLAPESAPAPESAIVPHA